MSILDITEDKIFQTFGRGRDPNFKPIDRASLIKTVEPFNYALLLK